MQRQRAQAWLLVAGGVGGALALVVVVVVGVRVRRRPAGAFRCDGLGVRLIEQIGAAARERARAETQLRIKGL